MADDLYHREKAEALISKLERDEQQVKKEVAKEERKLQKAAAVCRKREVELERKVVKLQHQNGLAEAWLKYRSDELRALKLTERQIQRYLKKMKRPKATAPASLQSSVKEMNLQNDLAVTEKLTQNGDGQQVEEQSPDNMLVLRSNTGLSNRGRTRQVAVEGNIAETEVTPRHIYE